MGIKILINTIEVDIIAKTTSCEPFIEALKLDDPDSIFLWIFSNMTIESSITSPVHNTSASKVIRFNENPNKFKGDSLNNLNY